MTINRAWGTCASLDNLASSHDAAADTACPQCPVYHVCLLCPALCSSQACSVLSRLASYIHTSMFLPASFGQSGVLLASSPILRLGGSSDLPLSGNTRSRFSSSRDETVDRAAA